jgi:hypothetical protein
MAHGTRIRTDAAWAIGSPWLDSERLLLDAALTSALNGDGGGTYNPTANIVVGGAGLRLLATTHTLSGSGAYLATSIANGKQLVHGDNDYCLLGSGHAAIDRVVQSPIARARYASGWTTGECLLVSSQYGATARVPLNVHNGAQFNTVDFNFIVANNTGQCPDETPARFGVFAKDLNGVVYPLSASMPYQGQPNYTSAAAWYANGLPQQWIYSCDGLSSNPYVLVDTSRFTYFAEIVEASSAVQANFLGATWFQDIQSSFVNIASIAPQ